MPPTLIAAGLLSAFPVFGIVYYGYSGVCMGMLSSWEVREMEYVVGLSAVGLSGLLTYLLAYRFGLEDNPGAGAIYVASFVIAFFAGLLCAHIIEDKYR